ncbi:MAG: O-antigen export protein [Patescibacteria group bacterium]|nr:O-antigen export protein [Patescibacteria group bacterium]
MPPDPSTPSPKRNRIFGFFERTMRTDLKYLSIGGLWLTIDQLASGLIALLLVIGFAQFVSPEVYGTYRYLLAALWILAAFTLTGLPAALSQAVARGFEGAFRHSFLWSIIGGLPLMAISFVASLYYLFMDNVLLSSGFFVIGLLGPLLQPSYLFGAYLSGKKNFKAMTLLGIVFAAVPAIGLGIAMFYTQSPVVFLLMYLCLTVLTGMSLYAYTYVVYRPNDRLSPDLRSLIGHFSAMNLLTTIAAQIDKLVVFHFLGAVQLAVYAIATAMPEQVRGLFSAVSTLAMPKFANRSIDEIRSNFWSRLWAFTGVLGVASLAYIVIAPFAFSLFLPTYMNAVGYSQFFALSLIMTSATIPTALLQAHAAKRELYIFNIATPIIQIAALIVFTILFGLVGAIVARIIARGFSLATSAFLVRGYFLRAGSTNTS